MVRRIRLPFARPPNTHNLSSRGHLDRLKDFVLRDEFDAVPVDKNNDRLMSSSAMPHFCRTVTIGHLSSPELGSESKCYVLDHAFAEYFTQDPFQPVQGSAR